MTLRTRRLIQHEFSRLSSASTTVSDRERREAREIVSWIRPRSDERVLDAACGPGRLAKALASRAGRVCGLDLCFSMLKAGRELYSAHTSPLLLTVGDVERLPYRSQSFHLVTCAYSFANFPDPLQVLREFARVTHRGGRVAVVDVVAPEDPVRRAYLSRLEALRSLFYTRILSRSQYVDLFRRARLRLESVQLHRRRQTSRRWLRLSSAAANPQRAHRLRQMLLDSIKDDKAGLHPRRSHRDIVFYHTTAWFVLRRD